MRDKRKDSDKIILKEFLKWLSHNGFKKIEMWDNTDRNRVIELFLQDQRIKETESQVCKICDSDHTNVKGIVGWCNCFLCFECIDKAKAKLNGLGTVTFKGETYKIVPMEETHG